MSGGKVQTKKSQIFKAAVTGDTVGDPLKDTSGPALNILMKLMAIISVAFAVLYIGLGVDYAVHFCLRHSELMAQALERAEALSAAARDVGTSLADLARAEARMGWKATRDLQAMCDDAWAWQRGRNR